MADDEEYFRRRAEQQLELAQRALDGAVVRAHYRLAEAYLEKAETTTASSPDRAAADAGRRTPDSA